MSNVLAFRQPDTVRPEATGKGFALMHRQFMDSKLYKDSQAVHLWLHLILKANYSPVVVKTDLGEMMVGRGQMITGRPTLVSETFIPDNKVKSLLRSFETKGMLKIEAVGRKFSLLTILKYDDFQSINCPTDVQRLSINNNITNNLLLNSNKSPSACAEDQPKQGEIQKPKTEKSKPAFSCQDVVDVFHEVLPEAKGVRALTDKRRNMMRTFWGKASKITRQLDGAPFTLDSWKSYLTYISTNCRWMLEDRPDTRSGKTWQKKGLEYFLNDETYLQVREGAKDDR